MKTHMETQNINKNLTETILIPCHLCNKQYKSTKALNQHIKSKHKTEKVDLGNGEFCIRDVPASTKEIQQPFCDICNITFTRTDNLSAHTKLKHTYADKAHQPEFHEDTKILAYKDMMYHNVEQLENKSTIKSNTKSNDISTKLKKKHVLHKCSHCNKLFLRRSHLKEHTENIHKSITFIIIIL